MEDTPKKATLLLIVISVTSLVYGQGAATPALADISRAFPGRRHETIQMIITIPPLLIMASTLVCGHLSRFLRKKTLVLSGMTLFAVGGILPAFFGGIPFILVMRGIFGAGCGFLIPLSQSLIADYFQGRDRDRIMGYRSSTASIFGMIFTAAGGWLCAVYWRYTFLAYLIVVPAFVVTLLAMPGTEDRKTAAAGEKAVMTRTAWFYVGAYFLYNVVMMCFLTNASFVMAASRVGNAGTIANIMTISQFGGIAAGMFLGTATRLLKNFTVAFALAFLALGFVLLNFVSTAVAFAMASVLWGVGFGTFNPLMALKVIGSVPKSAATLGLSLLTCAMGVGQFLSPHVYALVTPLLGLQGLRASWLVAAVCFVAAFAAVTCKLALTEARPCAKA